MNNCSSSRTKKVRLGLILLIAVLGAALVWPMTASADPANAQGYMGGFRYEWDSPVGGFWTLGEYAPSAMATTSIA